MKTAWRSLALMSCLALSAAHAEDASQAMKRADALFAERRYEESLKLFQAEAARAASPQAADALLMVAMSYDHLASQRREPALLKKEKAALQRLVKEYPQSPRTADAHLYLGQLEMGAPDRVPARPADYAQAMAHFDQAAQTADRDWLKAQAKGRKGQCLEELGRLEEARAAYRGVLKDYPDAPFAQELKKDLDPSSGLMLEKAYDLLSQAGQLLEQKKYEQSLALFEKVAADYPGSAHAASEALLLAAVDYDWLAKKRQDPALLEKEKAVLLRLVDKYPRSARAAEAYLYLGQVFSGHTGVRPKAVDCAKAMESYSKAVDIADRAWVKAQAKGRTGQCLEQLGRRAEARDAYAEVVRKYPDTPWKTEAEKLLKALDSRGQGG